MSESGSTASTNGTEPSSRVIELKGIKQKISESNLKNLLSSYDVRDKKKLNLIVKNVVEEGNTDAFKLLVDCGYKIDVISRNGQTPLHLAFYNCSSYKIEKDLVQLLFSCAGDENFKDSLGLTHLHVACVFGNVDMVKKCIKDKENINTCFRYQLTPLHLAVMHHRLEIVQLLVKNGAKISAADDLGRTPLHLAARVIDDVQKSYRKSSDLEILKFLVEHQFNIHMKDKDGNTPLLSIFQSSYADYEENLIWCNDDDDDYDDVSNSDSEDHGFDYIAARQKDKLTVLIKAGAIVKGANKDGDTILHKIIISTAFLRTPSDFGYVSFDDTYQVEMVKQILSVSQNLNINAENKKRETPLQVAVSCLSAKIVKILLSYKADTKNLRFEYFHYGMVPNFECVSSLISITRLLVSKGFKMTILNELPILRFLVHNVDNCHCADLDQYFDIRDYLQLLVHFGSSVHIKHVYKRIFKKSVINSSYGMLPILMDVLQYSSYMECGKFFIEKNLRDILTKTIAKSGFGMWPYKIDKEDIEKMKVTKLESFESVTLYQLMQKNPNYIYKYIENEDLATIQDFSDYRMIIKGQLTKAIMRNYIEKIVFDYLKDLIPGLVWPSCYKTVMKYLSNEDMVNIVEAIFLNILQKFKQS